MHKFGIKQLCKLVKSNIPTFFSKENCVALRFKIEMLNKTEKYSNEHWKTYNGLALSLNLQIFVKALQIRCRIKGRVLLKCHHLKRFRIFETNYIKFKNQMQEIQK